MPKLTPLFRILLAVFICGGLCRLDWSHIHSHGAPVKTSRVQVMQSADYEHGDLLVTRFPETASLHAHLNQNDHGASFIFECARPLIVSAPRLVCVASVKTAVPNVQSAKAAGVKNKDPPSVTGPASLFSSLTQNHFKLSYHETVFFALRASRICISLNRLCAHHEPGPGNRPGEAG